MVCKLTSIWCMHRYIYQSVYRASILFSECKLINIVVLFMIIIILINKHSGKLIRTANYCIHLNVSRNIIIYLTIGNDKEIQWWKNTQWRKEGKDKEEKRYVIRKKDQN